MATSRDALDTINCFQARAEYYERVHAQLGGRTRFFAAAAWVNRLLGFLSRQGLLGVGSSRLLEAAGSELLCENHRLSNLLEANRRLAEPSVLDQQLIEREQRVLEEFLQARKRVHPETTFEACREIDGLLNSGWFRFVSPMMPAPLCTMAQLARRQTLQFAVRAHRVALGQRIVDSMSPSVGAESSISRLMSGKIGDHLVNLLIAASERQCHRFECLGRWRREVGVLQIQSDEMNDGSGVGKTHRCEG